MALPEGVPTYGPSLLAVGEVDFRWTVNEDRDVVWKVGGVSSMTLFHAFSVPVLRAGRSTFLFIEEARSEVLIRSKGTSACAGVVAGGRDSSGTIRIMVIRSTGVEGSTTVGTAISSDPA